MFQVYWMSTGYEVVMLRHLLCLRKNMKPWLSVPGLAEIMEGGSCVTSELCAFWVFLEFCEAANSEEKPELDGQCSYSRYHRDYALASRQASHM